MEALGVSTGIPSLPLTLALKSCIIVRLLSATPPFSPFPAVLSYTPILDIYS